MKTEKQMRTPIDDEDEHEVHFGDTNLADAIGIALIILVSGIVVTAMMWIDKL